MTKLDAVRWTLGDPNDRTNTLVKIDVEGAEEEVLAGGSTWLNSSNCFLIEVHKEPYLESITRLFADKGLMLDRVDQQPLWMIGCEVRDKENWWLVSHLDFVR
jgi:Methyltransferase FkbM domain